DNPLWRETHAATGAFGTTSAFNEGHIRVPSQNGNDAVSRNQLRSAPGKEGGEVQSFTVPSIASAE
ncbi:MAG: hypothetical protein QNL90_06330, partial [Gammaproteobacteria bacterium]|nr:hypothetical protein [Gammaproteobacteria bacterium]MDX2459746.1 hypothetical protein [Gammaproteobacteria bacterium]